MAKTIPKSSRFNKKHDKTPYAVTLTGEQIKMIRSLHLRIEMMWLHSGVAINICADGLVERLPMHECLFCGQGSLDGTQTIQHTQNCIVPQAHAEFALMNAEFMKAEEAAKEQQGKDTE